MKVIDVLTSPWAIQPEKYTEIMQIYSARMRSESIDLKQIEAQHGKSFDNEQKRYEVKDGVAIIEVNGVLAKRMNLFTRISGGSSTEILAEDFKLALEDPQVKSILLHVDSPGGTVDGTQNLAKLIFESRGKKPITTLANGLMASAAVWIGTAADKVYITDETTNTGSIGVVTAHEDWSKWEENAGRKTTEIYAGKYKRIVSEFKPLGTEGKEYLQEKVDYIYSIFVNDVAKNRGVDSETVLKNMADAKIFIGEQGVEAGLVDGIISFDELVTQLSKEDDQSMFVTHSTAVEGGEKIMDPEITVELIEKEYPQIGQSFYDKGLAAGKTEGAAAELGRIIHVEAQSMPGHEDLIAELKFDGKTTGPEAAAKVVAAEKTNQAKTLSDLSAEAPTPAEATVTESGSDVSGLTGEEKLKAVWDKDEKLRAEFSSFDSYTAYMKMDHEGRIKISG